MSPIKAIAAAALCAAAALPAQAAVTYNFIQTGFSGGGQITGSFRGTDLDGDGWLFGYELTTFSLMFSGNADIAPFSQTKANLGGIGYRIGDKSIGGDHENSYLNTSSNSGGRFITVDSFGWPEFTIPGRIIEGSTGKSLISAEVIRVTAVPEPASWAMWLAGAGVLGGLARRRATSRSE